tara:strand:- start:246 stop:497 length:252 start_codon:yes stop_codon:yes gene_type:complete
MKKLDTKSNQTNISASADWEDLYTKIDPRNTSTSSAAVNYSFSTVPDDILLSKLSDLETRLMKIELALIHVIPHVLEKLEKEN